VVRRVTVPSGPVMLGCNGFHSPWVVSGELGSECRRPARVPLLIGDGRSRRDWRPVTATVRTDVPRSGPIGGVGDDLTDPVGERDPVGQMQAATNETERAVGLKYPASWAHLPCPLARRTIILRNRG